MSSPITQNCCGLYTYFARTYRQHVILSSFSPKYTSFEKIQIHTPCHYENMSRFIGHRCNCKYTQIKIKHIARIPNVDKKRRQNKYGEKITISLFVNIIVPAEYCLFSCFYKFILTLNCKLY